MARKAVKKAPVKAIFEVLKYPYNHPDLAEPVPVGNRVDLGHLPISDRQYLVDRRLMKVLDPRALEVPELPEPKPEVKLNKYGKPYGTPFPKAAKK